MDPFIEIFIKKNNILTLLLNEEDFIFFHLKSKKRKRRFNILNTMILKVFTKY
jgi:hypothetical protein